MQPPTDGAGPKPGMQKWTVEIEVSDTWVEDGFELTAERAHAMVSRDLSFAYSEEIVCRVIAKPDDDVVARLQGYASAEARRRELASEPEPAPAKYVIKARRATGFCYLADGPYGVVERTRHEQTVYLTADISHARTWTDVTLAEQVAATLKGSAGVETLPAGVVPTAPTGDEGDDGWADRDSRGASSDREDWARGT